MTNTGVEIVAILMVIVYWAVASVANYLLMKRSDHLIETQEMMDLQAKSETIQSKRMQPRMYRQVDDRASNRSHDSSHHLLSGTSNTSGVVSRNDAEVVKSSRWLHHLKDDASMFYMCLVVFAISRSVTNQAWLMITTKQADIINSRNDQDLFFAFSTFLYYIVPILLLHAFLHMADVERDQKRAVYAKYLSIVIAIYTILYWLFVVLQIVVGVHFISEYFGMIVSGCFALAFLATSQIVPRRLLKYGILLEDSAKRVRAVSTFLSLCFVGRLAMLLPPVQAEYQHMQAWSLVLYCCFDIIPTCLSLFFLHRKDERASL